MHHSDEAPLLPGPQCGQEASAVEATQAPMEAQQHPSRGCPRDVWAENHLEPPLPSPGDSGGADGREAHEPHPSPRTDTCSREGPAGAEGPDHCDWPGSWDCSVGTGRSPWKSPVVPPLDRAWGWERSSRRGERGARRQGGVQERRGGEEVWGRREGWRGAGGGGAAGTLLVAGSLSTSRSWSGAPGGLRG